MNFESIAVGDELPEQSMDITAKLIVGGAMATRDYQNVHHDKDAAQALGSPDIFMNILTTNGLVGRFVSDWSGAGSRLRKVAIRLGMPNYPGDVMRLRGEVVAVSVARRTVDVAVRGDNRLGNHVSGNVVVAFAEEAA